MSQTPGLIGRLRYLVSLHEPRNGGPYGGYAAEMCIRAMQEAADILERMDKAETKIYAINEHGRQLLQVSTIEEAVAYCRADQYFLSYPPKRIVIQESKAVDWETATMGGS